MNWLILPEARVAELALINTQKQVCRPMETDDGTLLICSDLLGDHMWANWHPFLSSLEGFQGEPIWKSSEE